MTSRREFIGRTALAAAGLSLPSAPVAREATTAAAPRRYLDIHRPPDRVTVQSATRDVRLILGDAWERGYGDLEWRGWVPDRVMPWYAATSDGELTHAYGVRTGARAFCFWQIDPQGVSLWADVRSGGLGVQLGERTLDVCDVVSRAGRGGESAFAAVHDFCRQMCPSPRLPSQPVYGSNDWYWVYGRNSPDTVRVDARP